MDTVTAIDPNPLDPLANATDGSAVAPQAAPRMAGAPMHTQTQSTLAPTSEYVRYLLLGLPARYMLRSPIEGIFGNDISEKFRAFRDKLLSPILKNHNTDEGRKLATERVGGVVYDFALGLGSIWLTHSYTSLVLKDIKTLFSETVGMEISKAPEDVSYADINRSDNLIIKRTLDNYKRKCWERYGADALFFVRPLFYLFKAPFTPPVGDMMIGVKAAQALGDTWKRKTTLFEDLVTFVNNKINPRNGLGQPISQGEIFDLYQHYADSFYPEKMFQNVLTHDSADSERWNKSQPIFQRLTELMNQTYAYKHSATSTDAAPYAGGANFALPKLIHLLGNNYIDPDKPAQTLTAIEVANTHGIPALKQMQSLLAQGQTLEQVQQHYHVTLHLSNQKQPEDLSKNGVLAKGSTMQLDTAPISTIDAASIADHAQVRDSVAQHTVT